MFHADAPGQFFGADDAYAGRKTFGAPEDGRVAGFAAMGEAVKARALAAWRPGESDLT